jgi:fructose-1,6-bisphosphatase I
MSQNEITTLEQFIVDQQALHQNADGSLSRIFRAIELAAKIVNRDVRKAGLIDILGEDGSINPHGEDQQKLDVIANNVFISALSRTKEVCMIISEENEGIVYVDGCEHEKYIIAIDPLDGSSNIDVNASIGSIFSVYKRTETQQKPQLEDCLQKGIDQVAAGYIFYGSSTMLVYTTGQGVNGFTLDDALQEFCLSHPNIKTPQNGSIFSVNEGNYQDFPTGIQAYIDYCKDTTSGEKKPYKARYIGSMIADFHRNLLKGGIFMYPSTNKAQNGKLRLMYECNPMALIAEQAGGRATDGVQRILDIQPIALHQRRPLYIGSKSMVDKAVEMLHQYETVLSNPTH